MLITAILVLVLLMLLFGVKAVRFAFWLIVLIVVIGVEYGSDDEDTTTRPPGSQTINSYVNADSTSQEIAVPDMPSVYPDEDVEWKRCNLASAMISSSAGWRDDGVPLLRAQNNVIDALNYNRPAEQRISGDWPYKWRNAIHEIYQSNVREDMLMKALRAPCKRGVTDVIGKLYAITINLTK